MKKQYIKLGVFILLAIVTWFWTSHRGQAGSNIWTTTGPYGVRIRVLEVDPENSQVIYAGTNEGSVYVYKSVDGGVTWLPSGNGIGEVNQATGFAFDANNSNIVYFASEWGIYKSTDAGSTWELKSTMVVSGTSQPIRAWSIDSSPTDGTLYVGGYSGPGTPDTGGIYRSLDGGETWERVASNETTDGIISAVAVAPSAPHIIYAGGRSSGGIFKSIDSGSTWTRIDTAFGAPPSINLHAITVDPHDARVVYVGIMNNGIFKTTNGGQTWSPIGTGLSTSDISSIEIDPGNQQVIYVGGSDFSAGTGTPGVYRSLDNSGYSWTSMMNGMGSRGVYSLAIDRNNPRNLYAGTGSGIWKYTLTSGPNDYGISINNGALFTNQTIVTLNLTAPPGTTEMILSNDGGFGGANWEAFAAQKSWSITSFGAYVLPRAVYAKFKTSGQTSGLYQDDIVLDITPPTGTVQIIDTVTSTSFSAASSHTLAANLIKTLDVSYTVYLPSVVKNSRPGFTQVGLLLSATDDLSGVGEVLVGGNSDFMGAEWAPYKERANWWISEGATVIYVKFRDRAGNNSPTYTVTISQ